MKRCPKCNRTYPDENQKFCTFDGGLLLSDQAQPPFDPNRTVLVDPSTTVRADPGMKVRATSTELVMPRGDTEASEAPTSTRLPDMTATVAAYAPTTASNEGAARPTGRTTSSDLTKPSVRLPPPPVAPATAPPNKSSKLGLILGILAILFVGGIAAAVGGYFFFFKPWLETLKRPSAVAETRPATDENSNKPATKSATSENLNEAPDANANTETKKEAEDFVPPRDSLKFANSKAALNGKLAEHYVDFSFYYPKSWEVDPKSGVPGASNFVKVERRLPPDLTQENLAVGWYSSKGTFEADREDFPKLVQYLSSNYGKNFPQYRKVSEGPIKVNTLDGYEFRFESLSEGTEKGDIKLWGRVIFLPTGVEGEKSGVTLLMLATSLAPDLHGVDDIGEKGQMPVILESFRFTPASK